MARIGYQNGVEAARLRMKKLDPGGFKADGSGAWDKFFRTISHLVIEHDLQFPPSPTPPPPPPPPPPPARLAAQTYNRGSRGQNARYCTAESGNPDGGGFHYNADGLCEGGRSEKFVEGLKPADEMDGRGPCDPYDGMPPWPEKSYER